MPHSSWPELSPCLGFPRGASYLRDQLLARHPIEILVHDASGTRRKVAERPGSADRALCPGPGRLVSAVSRLTGSARKTANYAKLGPKRCLNTKPASPAISCDAGSEMKSGSTSTSPRMSLAALQTRGSRRRHRRIWDSTDEDADEGTRRRKSNSDRITVHELRVTSRKAKAEAMAGPGDPGKMAERRPVTGSEGGPQLPWQAEGGGRSGPAGARRNHEPVIRLARLPHARRGDQPDELPFRGAVPPWLTGTLVRVGPARFEVGDRATTMVRWAGDAPQVRLRGRPRLVREPLSPQPGLPGGDRERGRSAAASSRPTCAGPSSSAWLPSSRRGSPTTATSTSPGLAGWVSP